MIWAEFIRVTHRYPFQVIHSRRFMRSGTVVGSFKIDLKTVYDAPGTDNDGNFHYIFQSCEFICWRVLSLTHVACRMAITLTKQIDFLSNRVKMFSNFCDVRKILMRRWKTRSKETFYCNNWNGKIWCQYFSFTSVILMYLNIYSSLRKAVETETTWSLPQQSFHLFLRVFDELRAEIWS